jgi:molecular chaperone GrpE
MEEELENKNSNSKNTNENTAEEVEDKKQSLEEKLKDTEDRLLRSLAEIENQRRRFEKEIKDALEYGGFNFAKEMISLLDNLQRAKTSLKNDSSLKDSKDLEKFLNNINIIEKDLISIFEKNKIKKIQCVKEKFDPNLHQAMLEIEDENNEPGTIIQEIQAGYMCGERLLRPSFVGVSKKKEKEDEEIGDKKKD